MCEASEFKGKHLQDITEKQIKHTKLNLMQWNKEYVTPANHTLRKLKRGIWKERKQ